MHAAVGLFDQIAWPMQPPARAYVDEAALEHEHPLAALVAMKRGARAGLES